MDSQSTETASDTAAASRTRTAPRLKSWRTVALIGGGALAVWLITRVLLALRFPIYIDEGIFASFSQRVATNPSDRFAALIDDKGLLATWIGAILVHVGMAPIAAVRTYAIVSSFAAAAVTSLLTYRIWGTREALVVAWATVLLPFLFVYSIIAQYDPFIAATSTGALYIQLQLVKRPRLDLAMLLGFVMGAGVLTKPSGWFAVILIPASLICFDWKTPNRTRRLLAWAGCLAIAVVLTAVAYSLQMLSPGFYDAGPENHHPAGDAVRHAFAYFNDNLPANRSALIGYLTIPGIGFLLVGLWYAFHSRPRFAALLVLWALVPIGAASIVATIAAPRYLLVSMPLVALLIGLGIFRSIQLATQLPSVGARLASLAAVGLLVLPAVAFDGLVLKNPDTFRYPGLDEWHYTRANQLSGVPLDPIVDEIRDRAGPGPQVGVTAYNSWNPGLLSVVLNGGDAGPGMRFAVQGLPPSTRPKTEFLILEDTVRSPYITRGWPRAEIAGENTPPTSPDVIFQQIQPLIGRYKLIKRVERPRDGPAVLLYMKESASTSR